VTAANNSAEDFLLVFGQRFQQALLDRMDRNDKVVFSYLDTPELSAEVVRVYGSLVQTRARVAYQEHCPIGELLGPDRESQYLEYKATLRTRADTGEVFKPLETATVKTAAAFLTAATEVPCYSESTMGARQLVWSPTTSRFASRAGTTGTSFSSAWSTSWWPRWGRRPWPTSPCRRGRRPRYLSRARASERVPGGGEGRG
jgi:hypothetical protein